jgi:hypothetical protein
MRKTLTIRWALLATITLLSSSSHAIFVSVDADAFPIGTTLNNAYPGVTLSVEGLALALAPNSTVVGMDGFSSFNGRNIATTGALVFGAAPVNPTVPQGWEGNLRIFRADFSKATNHVSIDLIADDDDVGQLSAFDSAGQLLEIVSTGFIRDQPFTAIITRPNADIAYITAEGLFGESMFLDRLQFDVVSEPAISALFGLGVLGLAYSRRKLRPKS